MRLAGTLHTVTRILRVPIYSGRSRNNLDVVQLATSFEACSFLGSRTSHVAKLLLQKYSTGMPAVCRNFLKTSFVKPVSLLVLRSTTNNDRILGSRRSDIPGMGKMMLSFRVRSILAHPISFIIFVSPEVVFQETGVFEGFRVFSLVELGWSIVL